LTPALADLTWTQIEAEVCHQAVLAVPLGSTEQHGPHLPLSVDADVALALCRGLARARSKVWFAPLLPYGSSGEHADFPGTLSIGQDALEGLLVELGRSATATFARIVFVSGHGGNAAPLERAVARLRTEQRDVRAFSPCWVGDPHAGRTETSLALALDPGRVRMEAAAVGNTADLAELMPALRTHGIRAVSPSGVLGDPREASVEQGHQLLDTLVGDLVAAVNAWWGPA